MASPNDLFIRDFKTVAGEDTGVAHALPYWVTSDVWNVRSLNLNGAGEVIVAEDALGVPVNDNPRYGTGTLGDNHMLARVRRRTAQAGDPPVQAMDMTITATFYVAYFGAGNGFVNTNNAIAGITFPSGVTRIKTLGKLAPLTVIPPVKWNITGVAQPHGCIAVEITGADANGAVIDPLLVGSIGTQHVNFGDDNNKAQRNQDAVPGSSLAPEQIAQFALVTNSDAQARRISVSFHTDAASAARWSGTLVKIVDGAETTISAVGALDLGLLQPGESRWVCLQAAAPSDGPIDVLDDTRMIRFVGSRPDLLVQFRRVVEGQPRDGFALGVRDAPLAEVLQYQLEEHEVLLQRLDAFGVDVPDRRRGELLDLLTIPGHAVSPKALRAFDGGMVKVLGEAATAIGGGRLQSFGIVQGIERADTRIRRGGEQLTLQTGDLVARVGAALTDAVLARGDATAIPRTVTWHAGLLRRRARTAGSPSPLLAELDSFTADLDRGTRGLQDYRDLVRSLPRLGDPDLRAAASTLDQPFVDAAAAQRAHREVLLALAPSYDSAD